MNNKTVLIYGRFQPPHLGHQKLIERTQQKYRDRDIHLFMSKSKADKRNPLPLQDKYDICNDYWGNDITVHKTPNGIVQIIKYMGTITNDMVFVVGTDRLDSFSNLVAKYNWGYNISVTVNDRALISATDLRSLAVNDDYKEFKQHIPQNPQLVFNLLQYHLLTVYE